MGHSLPMRHSRHLTNPPSFYTAPVHSAVASASAQFAPRTIAITIYPVQPGEARGTAAPVRAPALLGAPWRCGEDACACLPVHWLAPSCAIGLAYAWRGEAGRREAIRGTAGCCARGCVSARFAKGRTVGAPKPKPLGQLSPSPPRTTARAPSSFSLTTPGPRAWTSSPRTRRRAVRAWTRQRTLSPKSATDGRGLLRAHITAPPTVPGSPPRCVDVWMTSAADCDPAGRPPAMHAGVRVGDPGERQQCVQAEGACVRWSPSVRMTHSVSGTENWPACAAPPGRRFAPPCPPEKLRTGHPRLRRTQSAARTGRPGPRRTLGFGAASTPVGFADHAGLRTRGGSELDPGPHAAAAAARHSTQRIGPHIQSIPPRLLRPSRYPISADAVQSWITRTVSVSATISGAWRSNSTSSAAGSLEACGIAYRAGRARRLLPQEALLLCGRRFEGACSAETASALAAELRGSASPASCQATGLLRVVRGRLLLAC
ncbi:hypothetical protein WOLCODRAFT_164877 [Wolfiporia cocos MD-104 SS10]|uniref:Uncharacterized protein n=1 Tax=Wolfiporia cocos (strain MD-104) TaxID=742152 RepID=A0A2H3JP98_WOLCO|nr:hypothetical protein WOLCODRAFT_164877 [Wolfiporia cocos MD-104 SS10]